MGGVTGDGHVSAHLDFILKEQEEGWRRFLQPGHVSAR